MESQPWETCTETMDGVLPMLMSSLKCLHLQATQWLSTSAPKSDIDSAAKFIGAGKVIC